MSLRAADMDGDGDEDILISDRKGPARGVLWLDNPGIAQAASVPRWTERRLNGIDAEVMFLDRGDVVGDPQPDVVVAARDRGILILQWPTLAIREIPIPHDCGVGKAVAIGDIDLDGQADIVFTCEAADQHRSGARWLRKTQSESSWKDHEISGPRGIKFDRIELLDLDEDGDLDVLTCEERDNLGVIWYENPTR
jgi:hypothetical protein